MIKLRDFWLLLGGVVIGGSTAYVLRSTDSRHYVATPEEVATIGDLRTQLEQAVRSADGLISKRDSDISQLESELLQSKEQILALQAELARYKPTLVTEHYASGVKKSEGLVRNGAREGVWTTWHENQERESTCEYAGGKKWGSWARWSRSGKLIEQGFFVDDKRDGEWIFTEEDSTDDNIKVGVAIYRHGEYVGPK